MPNSQQPEMLSFDEAGTGAPLVLVHGFPLDRSLWGPQVEALRSGARLIVPDLRGFGASPGAPEVATMEDHADDLRRLLDHLGIGRAVVCGLSMGGYVALAFTERHPELVAGLVLANTRAGADSEAARAARHASVETALASGVAPIADALLPKLLTPATIAERPDLADFVRRMMAGQPVAGVVAALRGMATRSDRSHLLPSVGVPTLVVTGAEDTLIPVAESEAMAAAIPGSTLTILPGAGHLSNLEDPDGFNGAVRGLMASVVSG